MSDIENKLFTVKYTPDEKSHLLPVQELCQRCDEKYCTIICPANVYKWDNTVQKLIVNYENCLECGACRISCQKCSIGWEYPKGTKGVMFKQG